MSRRADGTWLLRSHVAPESVSAARRIAPARRRFSPVGETEGLAAIRSASDRRRGCPRRYGGREGAGPSPPMTFQHEALIYGGRDGFLAGTLPFIHDGLEAGEPVLVAVDREKISCSRTSSAIARRSALRRHATLGANPNRIIPAWRDFLAAQQGRPARGIGEPIWAGRSSTELVECQLHEALLNVAFADSDGFRLMCPYDEDALDPAVVHEARCSHPLVSHEHGAHASRDFRSSGLLAPFEAPLPPPPAPVEVHSFEIDTLHEVRQIVARAGQRAGLREDSRRGPRPCGQRAGRQQHPARARARGPARMA